MDSVEQDYRSSVRRQKGESQNGGYKNTKISSRFPKIVTKSNKVGRGSI